MLSSRQMATKAPATAEQYLHMTFEYDAEFVRGEIVERTWPDTRHSRAQAAVCFRLEELRSQFRLLPCIGIRMKLNADLYRVADVAVFAEIITREDRYHDVMEKFEEYRVWGVPNLWLVDPYAQRLWSYSQDGLRNCPSLTLAEYPLELTPAVLFSDL